MRNVMLINFMEFEALALIERVDKLRPFSVHLPMVAAASVDDRALKSMERHLNNSRCKLKCKANAFLAWLRRENQSTKYYHEAQRRFTFLRLQFNAVLNHFDIFSVALTQRSEHGIGVWLAGLDALAEDALKIPSMNYKAPPVVCYLGPGAGAAIRRANTRLPGGGRNPVSFLRVPRERMVGGNIAGSLVHEVGHQVAAMIDIVPTLREAFLERSGSSLNGDGPLWETYASWISEIFADFWSIGQLGTSSTAGLISVLSLPRTFVMKPQLGDPHPTPWLRVLLGCAFGRVLYPHSRWDALEQLWRDLYPLASNVGEIKGWFDQMVGLMPDVVDATLAQRFASHSQLSVIDLLPAADRGPKALLSRVNRWEADHHSIWRTTPGAAFATLGEARLSNHISPAEESRLAGQLLNHWALTRRLGEDVGQARRCIKFNNPSNQHRSRIAA